MMAPKSGREAWYIGPVECADAPRNDGSPFQSHPVSVFDIPGIVQPKKINKCVTAFESVDPHSSRTRVAIFLGLPLPGTAAGVAAVGVQGASLPGHAHRHPAVNTRRDSTPKRALAGRVKLLTV